MEEWEADLGFQAESQDRNVVAAVGAYQMEVETAALVRTLSLRSDLSSPWHSLLIR